jgi:hypothetical protein
MPSEIFHWFVSLAEVLMVITIILLVGLVLAVVAFWIFARITGALSGMDADSDFSDDEFGDSFESEAGRAQLDDSKPEETFFRER